MKKCLSILVFIFFLTGCLHITAFAVQEDFDISSGHSGFNGYKWGTRLSEFPSFELVRNLPRIKKGKQYWDPNNEFVAYLGCKTKILYNFMDNRLFGVVMVFPVDYDFGQVASLLNSRYGAPSTGDSAIFTWFFVDSIMYWYFQSDRDSGTPAQVVIIDMIQMRLMNDTISL